MGVAPGELGSYDWAGQQAKRHRAGRLLEAFRALPGLMEARRTIDVPTGHLDAEKVAVDLVPPAWRRIVFPAGRPEGTVRSRRPYAEDERMQNPGN